MSLWAAVLLVRFPMEVTWSSPTFELYSRVVSGSASEGSLLQKYALWPWYRWDAEWYLRIAVEGYQTGGSAAFAPLYPFLVRTLGLLLGGRYLWAGLLISNLSLLCACVLLYREGCELFGEQAAGRAVLYFLAFPSAFFLLGMYTESLFILMVLLAWTSARRGLWLWTLLLATLATLTRFQGFLLVVPLLLIWWKSSAPRLKWGFGLLAVPGVIFLWSGYTRFALHVEFPWQALEHGWEQKTALPWEGILNNILALAGRLPQKGDPFKLFLDLFATLLFLWLIYQAYRLLPLEYSLYMGAMFLLPLMKVSEIGVLVSMSRYVLPLFPAFILLGRLGGNRYFHLGWLVVSLFFQALASAIFFLWYWVA